jgi:hypothetical protein
MNFRQHPRSGTMRTIVSRPTYDREKMPNKDQEK